MAQRDAAVRLTLNAGSFVGGLREISRQAEVFGQRIGKALSGPMKAGFAAGRDAAGALIGDIKGALKAASTLGGALSVGAGMQSALQLSDTYKNLAFELSMATGKAVRWQDVQRDIETAAIGTSRSSEELAGAFKSVKDETGDIGLAAASMRMIGVAANVSGKGTSELAGVVGALNDKFGVTTTEMPDMLAAMLELSNRGGLSFEDLTKSIHLMGGSARAAGYMGADGVRRMIAMANIGGDALGTTKKGLGAIQSIVDKMADPSTSKEMKQTFGVDVKDKGGNTRDITDVLSDVMGKTKGQRSNLAKFFKGEELKLVTEVGKYFVKGYEASSGGEKEKVAAGTKAFRDALMEAGETSTDFAALEAENAKRMEDPSRKLQAAMTTFYSSFTKPEMLSAMESLSKSLPKLAEGMGKLVEFVAKNPMLAGGMYAGARVGGAGAMSFAGDAGKTLVVGGGKKLGAEIAASFAADVASKGKWGAIGKNVGAAAGIAIAAYVAYELGKKAIDATMGKSIEGETDLRGARFKAASVARSGTPEEKAAALASLRTQIQRSESEGPGVVNTMFGGIAHAVTGGEVKTAGERHADTLAMAKADAAELEASLTKGGTNVGAALEKGAAAINAAANRLNSAGAPGSNGLPPAPGGAPGHG